MSYQYIKLNICIVKFIYQNHRLSLKRIPTKNDREMTKQNIYLKINYC